MQYEFHSLANLFPLVEGADFADLVEDVRANGILDPIDLYEGKILDGRNRFRAAVAAGIELGRREFRTFHPEFYGDPLTYVISKNLRRRHLDDVQRASVAGKIANISHGGDRSKPPIGGLTVDQAAATLNVAPRQVERARVVHGQGVPELRDALDRGLIGVSAAERIARLLEDDQRVEVTRMMPRNDRAIMGSRREPDDSLDFFPTPPFATRALIEFVLPELGISAIDSAWEPACGEGHIADVLREYCPDVHASDIFDYGYQDELLDFLSVPEPQSGELVGAYDWIITNPPFEEKALEFTLQALKWARVGVAMFVPLRWLETIGRYQMLFLPTPPALVCPFVERVPLCKGEWNPAGGTATAYQWLVWRHVEGDGWRGGAHVFWIPPICKETLTRPDDATRFTAHPVTKRQASVVLGVDMSSGPDVAATCVFHSDTGEIADNQVSEPRAAE